MIRLSLKNEIVGMFIAGLFFFSSRRRHTRYWRDWSSDVCSSDLEVASGMNRDAERHLALRPGCHLGEIDLDPRGNVGRSEERRVGKECRFRWWRQRFRKQACSAQCQRARQAYTQEQ